MHEWFCPECETCDVEYGRGNAEFALFVHLLGKGGRKSSELWPVARSNVRKLPSAVTRREARL